MIYAKLTSPAFPAHKGAMRVGRIARLGVISMLGAFGLGGCITLEAPDKPIVIELNMNITQEVIYRLAEAASNTIDENPDIF